MRVGEIKKLIKNLPDDMPALIEIGEGEYVSVCGFSGVETVVVIPEGMENVSEVIDDREMQRVPILLFRHCRCDEPEKGEINSQPKLN